MATSANWNTTVARQMLRYRCLVAEDPINPFTLLLVDGSSRCRRVGVDVDRWGKDEYAIDRTGAPAVGRWRGGSTIPMHHEGDAFDWRALGRDELHGLLVGALQTGDPSGLVADVGRPGAHRPDLPEGRDAHEYGDFALTPFEDPAAGFGLGYG
jgi:hypothetical protein